MPRKTTGAGASRPSAATRMRDAIVTGILREATDLAATWKEHQQTQDGAYRNDLERAIDSHLTVLADYRRMYAAARRLP
jgi:hypothetical protein